MQKKRNKYNLINSVRVCFPIFVFFMVIISGCSSGPIEKTRIKVVDVYSYDQTKGIEQCENLLKSEQNKKWYNSCISRAADSLDNPEYCDKMNPELNSGFYESTYNSCVQGVILDRADDELQNHREWIEVCKKINNYPGVQGCYQEFGKYFPEVCEKISISSMKNNCYTDAAYGQINTVYCQKLQTSQEDINFCKDYVGALNIKGCGTVTSTPYQQRIKCYNEVLKQMNA